MIPIVITKSGRGGGPRVDEKGIDPKSPDSAGGGAIGGEGMRSTETDVRLTETALNGDTFSNELQQQQFL